MRRWSPRRRTRRTGRGRRWPQRTGLSKSTIGRIWKAFELKPHRADGFKLSNDPLFVEKVYDVVGLYLNPPESAVVLSRGREIAGPGAGPVPAGVPDDAGHAREAHPRLRPARHHQPVRRVQHRRRHRDLQPAPPAPGRRVQEVPDQDRRRGPRRPGRAPGLRQLRHPQDPAVKPMAGRHTRGSTMHFTPTYSSWINQVERLFALRHRATSCNAATTAPSKHSKPTSATGSTPGTRTPNPSSGPKTAEQILESLGRLLQRITGAGH